MFVILLQNTVRQLPRTLAEDVGAPALRGIENDPSSNDKKKSLRR